MENTKKWYASKTFWINAALIAGGILDLASSAPIVPESALPWIVLAAGVINLILRVFFPSPPIELPPAVGSAVRRIGGWISR